MFWNQPREREKNRLFDRGRFVQELEARSASEGSIKTPSPHRSHFKMFFLTVYEEVLPIVLVFAAEEALILLESILVKHAHFTELFRLDQTLPPASVVYPPSFLVTQYPIRE